MMTLIDKAGIIDMHLRGMTNTEIAEGLGIHRNMVGEYESHAKDLRRAGVRLPLRDMQIEKGGSS